MSPVTCSLSNAPSRPLAPWLRLGVNDLRRRSPRHEQIKPILRDLHWLRSPERIDFKLAVLVYRCLHGLAPHYLSDYFQHVAYSTVDDFVHRHHRIIDEHDSQLSATELFQSLEAASGTVFHTSLCQLQLSLFSESGSKLIFSLYRSRCN